MRTHALQFLLLAAGCVWPLQSAAATNQAHTLFVIAPYQPAGTWVFDDRERGLVKEPLVAGIPQMISVLTTNIPNATQGFRLLFSAQPFPGYQIKLEWRRREDNGNWYYCAPLKRGGLALSGAVPLFQRGAEAVVRESGTA